MAVWIGIGIVSVDVAAAQTAPAPDPLAEADRTVEQLRRQADAASAQYFAELARFASLDRAVADLEARIPQLKSRARKLKVVVRQRAIDAYEHSARDLTALVDGSDSLDIARRNHWLSRLNARDDATVESLVATLNDLSAQRDDLRTKRAAESDALAQVRRQGDAIDATLTAAVNRLHGLQAAAAAAAAASAATAATSTTLGRQSTPTTKPAAAPGRSPARATPPAAPPTYTPTAGVNPHHDDPFLACTRGRESGGNYAAFNPAGPYLGAYQFLQSTWNAAANHAGRTDLIGVPPNAASPFDQDDVAWSLYQAQGKGPWGGAC
jgi:hypothetical protein